MKKRIIILLAILGVFSLFATNLLATHTIAYGNVFYDELIIVDWTPQGTPIFDIIKVPTPNFILKIEVFDPSTGNWLYAGETKTTSDVYYIFNDLRNVSKIADELAANYGEIEFRITDLSGSILIEPHPWSPTYPFEWNLDIYLPN